MLMTQSPHLKEKIIQQIGAFLEAALRSQMKLNELVEDHQYCTKKLGDICRQLNFSGIAIVWIFSSGNTVNIATNDLFFNALLFYVFSFTFEITQYVYNVLFLHFYHRHKELEFKADDSIKKPEDIDFEPHVLWNVIGDILLILKVSCTIVGYIYLMRYMLAQI